MYTNVYAHGSPLSVNMSNGYGEYNDVLTNLPESGSSNSDCTGTLKFQISSTTQIARTECLTNNIHKLHRMSH